MYKLFILFALLLPFTSNSVASEYDNKESGPIITKPDIVGAWKEITNTGNVIDPSTMDVIMTFSGNNSVNLSISVHGRPNTQRVIKGKYYLVEDELRIIYEYDKKEYVGKIDQGNGTLIISDNNIVQIFKKK